ncbi:MAG: outer membrane beta-barrel protein [Octadecabacter sp.]|nr:outer membrane beta-barrel protein [Octadecabacter sp.]
MKRTTLLPCAAVVLAMVTPAFAGNMSEPVVTPAPAPMPAPAPVSYGGDWTGFYAGGSLGYADVGDDAAVFGDEFNGLTYGVHAGYDYDFGNFVLGGEFELSGFDVQDNNTATEVDSVARLKLRAGYDAGNFLPYLAVGAAQLKTSGAPLGGVDDTGYFYGAGVDYRLTDSIRVGGEVLQHEFDDYAGSGINPDALTAAVRVSFEF